MRAAGTERRGFAIVGASDRGIPWAKWAMTSLSNYGYEGEVWPVNPSRDQFEGVPCFPDLAALPAVPEAAAIVTNAELALGAVEQLLDAGCRRIQIISNGFAELGNGEGRERDARLKALCSGSDALVVGPNCVGFGFFHEGLVAIAEPIPHGLVAGDVSLVSQSGGLTAAALAALRTEHQGIDFAASLGNGSVLDVAGSLEYLLARDTTRVVLGVVESLTDRDAIERAAESAAQHGKTIALLLLGATEGARGVAASHTGAVVSEQRSVGAWLRSLGIVTVGSVNELARVAALSAVIEPAQATGGFVATLSGGGAGLTADLAARHHVPLAEVSDATALRLREALPDGAFIGNPLDINTGDASAVYTALADDPGVSFLIEPWNLPWPTEAEEYHWQRAGMARLADVAEQTGLPVVVASVARQAVSDWMHEYARGSGLLVSADLELTLAALSALARAPRTDGDLPGRRTAASGEHAAPTHIVAEAAARELLAAGGVPVVRGSEEVDADAIVARATELVGPFAVKLSLSSVAHKGRVGGVVLGVDGEGQLRDACARIRANAIAAGVSDGSDVRYLITEMVSGPELLVGVVRDPVAGPCVTVAIGGWAAEAGAIFGTVPASADLATWTERIEAWGLAHLAGSDRTLGLAEFFVALGTAVSGPLRQYREIELNPVMLTERGPLVIDALLTTAD